MSEEKLPASGAALFWSMFATPVQALASLRERPRWLFPIVFSASFSVAVNFYVIRHVGLARLVSASVKANAVIDAEAAMQNVLAHQNVILSVQALSTFASSFLTALVIAKVLWLLLILFGHDLVFKHILAVVAHANMIPVIIRESMLGLTATIIRDSSTFDMRNPLATNLAFFFRPDSPAAFRMLASLDVITFLNMYLLAVGLTKVCAHLSPRGAALTVIIPWAVYVGATAFISYMSLAPK